MTLTFIWIHREAYFAPAPATWSRSERTASRPARAAEGDFAPNACEKAYG